MPGVAHSHGSSILKALVALTISSSAAAASSSMLSRVSCAAPLATAAAAPASSNRWVSKALATRGGADETGSAAGAGEAESPPGVLSEVQIAMSSFSEIAGETLLVVDDAKKGTTKEVSYKRPCQESC